MDLFELAVASKLAGGGGGGGGGSSYTLLEEKEYEITYSSTSKATIETITVPEAWTSAKMILVSSRDKAGKRNGYYLGTDAIICNTRPVNEHTSAFTSFLYAVYSYDASGYFQISSGIGGGIFADQISSDGTIRLRKQYNSSSTLTIDGTYTVKIYALDWPGNEAPFK